MPPIKKLLFSKILKSTKKTPISFELQASDLALQICLSDIVGIKNDVIYLRGSGLALV